MSEATLIDELLDPFALCLDPAAARRVAAFRVPPPVQQRVDALAERANEGVLSGEERSEYEAIVNAVDVIALLRIKARRASNIPRG